MCGANASPPSHNFRGSTPQKGQNLGGWLGTLFAEEKGKRGQFFFNVDSQQRPSFKVLPTPKLKKEGRNDTTRKDQVSPGIEAEREFDAD